MYNAPIRLGKARIEGPVWDEGPIAEMSWKERLLVVALLLVGVLEFKLPPITVWTVAGRYVGANVSDEVELSLRRDGTFQYSHSSPGEPVTAVGTWELYRTTWRDRRVQFHSQQPIGDLVIVARCLPLTLCLQLTVDNPTYLRRIPLTAE